MYVYKRVKPQSIEPGTKISMLKYSVALHEQALYELLSTGHAHSRHAIPSHALEKLAAGHTDIDIEFDEICVNDDDVSDIQYRRCHLYHGHFFNYNGRVVYDNDPVMDAAQFYDDLGLSDDKLRDKVVKFVKSLKD